MKYINFSEKKSYIKLNNYRNTDFTTDVLLYISLSFNEMPKSWYTVISIMEKDYDNQAVFNFRIKDDHAQWYYGNDDETVVLDIINFNRFFKKDTLNEVVLIRKENCFLKMFVNTVLVGVKKIVSKGKPKNRIIPLSIMRSSNNLIQAKLEKLYISTKVDDIISANSSKTRLDEKFDYIFDLEYDCFPSYELISNGEVCSFEETVAKKIDLEWISILRNFDFVVVNDVLVTDNDFLFLYQGKQRQIDYLTGLLKPNNHSINSFRENILERRAYCINKNIDYLHIVYPAKPIVKSNLLPKNISSKVSSIFLNHYSTNIDYVLYPLDELRVFNDLESLDKEVFRVKDTHMTDFGYSCIAKVILKKLGMDFHLLDSFFEVEEKFCSSDLQVMMGDRTKTTELIYSPYNNNTCNHIYYDNRGLLSGNTGNIVLSVNKRSLTDKSLLVFGDSFFKDSLKMFIPFFKNILFIRSSFFLKDIVELFNPDIVITSNAERYLSDVLLDGDNRIKSPLFHENLKGDRNSVVEFREAWEAFLSVKYYPHVYHSWYNEH